MLTRAALFIELIPLTGYFPVDAFFVIFVPWQSGLKVLRIIMGMPLSRAGLIEDGNITLAPKWEISSASV
jgi:hypothetical protein